MVKLARVGLIVFLVGGLVALRGSVGAQDGPSDAEAAQAVIDALATVADYDSYVLTVSEFTELDERLYPAGAGQNDNRGRLLAIDSTVITGVDRGAGMLGRRVDAVIEGDLILGARLIGMTNIIGGEVLAVDGAIYLQASVDGLDSSQTAPPDGWIVVDEIAPTFEGVRFFGVDDVRAYLADPLVIPSAIGMRPQQIFVTPDDILSRVDEIRVQEGRTTGENGGSVTFYRLLGDGLADVVATTAPVPIPDEAALEAVIGAITDASVAVVVDDRGRLITRIVNYNFALIDADATLFGLAAGTLTVRAAVNVVEQYTDINRPPFEIEAPELE